MSDAKQDAGDQRPEHKEWSHPVNVGWFRHVIRATLPKAKLSYGEVLDLGRTRVDISEGEHFERGNPIELSSSIIIQRYVEPAKRHRQANCASRK